MYDLIKLVFDICLFKKGPQDIPHSTLLLKLFVLMDFGISYLIFNIEVGGLSALLQAIVGVALVLATSGLTVYWANKPERFCQTATALVGVDTMVGFFALPGIATMVTGYSSGLVFWVLIGLIVWHWAITGHIIRQAIAKNWAVGLGIAFLYFYLSYQVMSLLFPGVNGVN